MKRHPKMRNQHDLTRRFPTTSARDLADLAVDAIPDTEPMTAFLDAWLSAYRAAGGIERTA